MAQDNKVVSIKGQKPLGHFTLPVALVRLRDVSGQSLKSVLSGFFERADDVLFELADKAGSNRDQTAYFDAMRELRLRRKHMTVSALQYVSQAFNDIGHFQPGNGSTTLDEVDQDSLALVDHSDLEQQVAIDNLITKLRNRYTDTIRLLNVRVNHLVPSLKLTDSQMPLSPEVLCGGIAEACADLDIDIRAKLVVLKLFDRLLVDRLGSFYQEANQTLVAEGVLPDMKRPPVGGPAASTRSPSASASGYAGPGPRQGYGTSSGGAVGSAPEGAGATFSELSALLHQGGNAGMSSGQGTGANFLDTQTLMSRLNTIQGLPEQWESDSVVSLTDQLQPVLQADNGGRYSVAQMDGDVINLVSMLFDFILEDRQLHPVMKAMIGRLQIPVLKVALSDKNFFNRGGHPVRKLLNELAMSAIGWTEKKSGQRDPLRDKIESVVNRVLSDFTNNVELFSELLAEFSHFMDLDRRRRELVEQRLRDAEEGRARQENASKAAEDLLSELTSGRDLPAPVASLLQDVWSRYLQWVVLREGNDSKRWNDARVLTGQLIWSVDPRPITEGTRSELLRAIPGIVDGLRAALQEISWDPFATDTAIRDLELAHVDVFQRLVTHTRPQEVDRRHTIDKEESKAQVPPAESAEPFAPELPDIEQKESAPIEAASVATVEEPEVEAVTDEVVAPDAQWLDRADAMRVGSWIELSRDGNKLRCKLAAFIKATGKYIFVNRSGAKVAEYHRGDLANALAAGDIAMLDDGLIFDRALESIIDNLRNSRKD